MTMLSRKLAGLTLGVALLALVVPAAQAAEGQQKEAQEKKQEEQKAAPAKPRKPAEVPLRFTDLDLEKYHGRPPAPAEDETGGEEEAATVPGPGQKPAPGASPLSPAPPAGAAGRRTARPVTRPAVRPPGLAPRPEDDPLKPFRDREAKESFRSGQIQKMRDRIADIDKRLSYLRAKKNAVLNPFTLMPQPQSEDETTSEASLRPMDLLDRIDGEIKGLEEEKEQVQAELVSVETRFEQESRSR